MNASFDAVSRRALLQGAGALFFTIALGDAPMVLAQTAPAGKPPLVPTELDSWIAIAPDGAVTVFFGKIDGGQGTDVGIAQIVAEEMDVNVAKVSVVMGDTARTCNQGGASGSTGIRSGGAALRIAGAEARRVLVGRAAETLGVTPEQVSVSDGVVSVTADPAKRIAYAQLIAGGYFHSEIGWNKQLGNGLMLNSSAKVKTPDQYKVVGTSPPRYDVAGKVFGTKPFVSDIRVPGMLHGRMIRPPVAGAVPVSIDEASIADIPGVRVVHKGNFLGVVAEKEWNAIRAQRALKVTWSQVLDPFPEQAKLYDFIRAAAVTKRDEADAKGDTAAVFAGAAKVVSADYEWPFQSHASMGPGCGLADVKADSATIWTGTQKPHYGAQGVAAMLGLPQDKVHAIWVTGPGSYGRNDAGDAAMDAAVLSQAVGKPVRVQYMRNEGHGWDPKAPASVHHARAALDAQGNIVALEFSSKGFSRVDTNSSEADPGDTLAGMLLGKPRVATAAFNHPENAYEFPDSKIAWECIAPLVETASPLRTSHMRDPLGPQIAFANESFMDELAFAAGADPVEFRLRHIKKPRDAAVIRAAAEKAGWKPGAAGTRRTVRGDIVTGRGIGYAQRGGTIVAIVVDVEVNKATGALRVPRVTVAHDCGLIINPTALRHTIEGNIVQGLSRAIHEEVRFNTKAVTSIDWLSYPIVDITEAPEIIDIVLVNHPELPPTGAGEGSTRPMAAAVNNALFEAIGTRLRRAPLTPERIKAGMV